MILAVTQYVSEDDKLNLHADCMSQSQIYYALELMCYYLWTTFTPGNDPCQHNFKNEGITNKINFIVPLPELVSTKRKFIQCSPFAKIPAFGGPITNIQSVNQACFY